MSDFFIKSHKGEYSVNIINDPFDQLSKYNDKTCFIIDKKVFELYQEQLKKVITDRYILIEATEENKQLDKFSNYTLCLVEKNIKRDHILVAIGGGIIQDITCFLASTLFRGMEWQFFPTTLLAQADSCIGSKSSINIEGYKNLMGTFYPPSKIFISMSFLETLSHTEMQSGVGEILKVHMIDSLESFLNASQNYFSFFNKPNILETFILNSLKIKQKIIETDEFDKNLRNIMNYGHSFGHAIESATNFNIPHGVAVTIGMDMANYFSYKLKLCSENLFRNTHNKLVHNFKDFNSIPINFDLFSKAISADKKNVEDDISLILVQMDKPINKIRVPKDEMFWKLCKKYFKEEYRNA